MNYPPLDKRAYRKEMLETLAKVKEEGVYTRNPFFDLHLTMDEMEKEAWERYPKTNIIQRKRKVNEK